MQRQTLAQLQLASLAQTGPFFPSPTAWEDQVFYFLLVDRFSDGNEREYCDNEGNLVLTGTTPPLTDADRGNVLKTEADTIRWQQAGARFVGGTLKGIQSKLGYLKRLGITALWISPIFKQVRFQETYHGYGIQNFLEVDPKFGSSEDLRELVRAAHELGFYVILDIILNHTGNVFTYGVDRHSTSESAPLDPPWDGETYQVAGFNDKHGQPTIPFQRTDPDDPSQWPDPEGAIWPVEFQDPEVFHRKGTIHNWHDDPEYREGDFADLRDINHGEGEPDDYQVAPALRYLCQVYQFWIAYADLDGFRIDTVRHMDIGATRFFATAVHEFAQSLGKEQFLLVGEITGGHAWAYQTRELTGLDAALALDDLPNTLGALVKGECAPQDYFQYFRNFAYDNQEMPAWLRHQVMVMYDDHDRTRQGHYKSRLCADPIARPLILNALALTVLGLGIPCVYYGSEQGFDGEGDQDRYIREAMFGGEFGAFKSRGVHCFNEDQPIYQELSKILHLRQRHLALRRGRQYLRPIAPAQGQISFALPQLVGVKLASIVAWSRVFNGEEILLAMNATAEAQTAWVSLEQDLHPAGAELTCLYSTNPAQIGQQVTVELKPEKAVLLTVPAAGFVMFA